MKTQIIFLLTTLFVLNAAAKSNELTYIISKDKKSVEEVQDKKTLRTFKILEACSFSGVGAAEVRNVVLKNETVIVTFGKHDVAEVNVKTGEITCKGAN